LVHPPDSVKACPDHPLGEEARGLLRSKRRTLAQTTAPPHLTYEIASSGYYRNGRVWPLGLC
jgi:hypothetical protein